jgi:two-component system, OmpR family, sensor histidine kinase KdpD
VIAERLTPRGPKIGLRAIAVGLLATAAASLLALPASELGPASDVAVFMLAVTIAAVTGGLWGGVLSAVLASVVLPIVELPDNALRFDEPRDVVAAVVFLAIAVVVGLVVGSAADEQARAARREREARLLAHLSATLLSGDVPDRVLDDFVQLLLEPLGLATCQVRVTLDGLDIEAHAVQEGIRAGGPTEIVPVVVADVPLGTLIVERPSGRRSFTKDERLLLEAATRQAAVALDRARLDARARLAQLDAETSQLRAAMFSSVTHDLRTPLASIKAGVTSLLDRTVQHDAAQEQELLQTILEETDRLNRLVGNILDLARIRAGALIPRRAPTAVDEVAEAVVARLRPMFRSRDVTMELMLPPELPEIPADPVQLDQVLTNLLENAAVHSPRGGKIRMHVSPTTTAVRIRVSDEGRGIPREEREKVFEAFYRGRESPESRGSGLGLSIARAIVTAHGGRIWIDETVGGGTAIVIDLPLEESVLL